MNPVQTELVNLTIEIDWSRKLEKSDSSKSWLVEKITKMNESLAMLANGAKRRLARAGSKSLARTPSLPFQTGKGRRKSMGTPTRKPDVADARAKCLAELT